MDKELLAGLRRNIDAVDTELMAVLAKRQALVQQVLEIKLKEGLPARIPDRIAAVIDGAADRAVKAGVDPSLARAVWSTMVEWFVAHEEHELATRKTSKS